VDVSCSVFPNGVIAGRGGWIHAHAGHVGAGGNITGCSRGASWMNRSMMKVQRVGNGTWSHGHVRNGSGLYSLWVGMGTVKKRSVGRYRYRTAGSEKDRSLQFNSRIFSGFLSVPR
jgi:hypothetical protein